MSIKKTGKGTYKFGESGKEYADRAGAVNQMKAMFSSGYRAKSDPNEKAKKKTTKKRPKK